MHICVSMWDPSFLTRDWTHDPCGGSTESQALDCRGNPSFLFLMRVCSRQAVVKFLSKKPRDCYLNRGFSVNPDLLETFLSVQPSSELKDTMLPNFLWFALTSGPAPRRSLNTPQASFLIIIALSEKCQKHCNIEKFTKHNAIHKVL